MGRIAITSFDKDEVLLSIQDAAATGRLLYLGKKRSRNLLAGRPGSNSPAAMREADFNSNIRNFWANVNWKKSGKTAHTTETKVESDLAPWQKKLLEAKEKFADGREDAFTVDAEEELTYEQKERAQEIVDEIVNAAKEAMFNAKDGKKYTVSFSSALNEDLETVYSIGNIRQRKPGTGKGSSVQRGNMTSDLNGAQDGAKASSRIVYETGEKSQDKTRDLADWQKKLLEAKEKFADGREDAFAVDVEEELTYEQKERAREGRTIHMTPTSTTAFTWQKPNSIPQRRGGASYNGVSVKDRIVNGVLTGKDGSPVKLPLRARMMMQCHTRQSKKRWMRSTAETPRMPSGNIGKSTPSGVFFLYASPPFCAY